MTDIKAADLPEGSVVVTRERAFIRAENGAQTASEPARWACTDGGYYTDRYLDEWFRDGTATVLREGISDA